MRPHNLHDFGVTMTKIFYVLAGFSVILLALSIAVTSQAAEHPDSLYRQAKYKEAMAGYEKLDLDNPKDIIYRFNRGCAAYQLKDYQSALAAFTSVYTRSQDNDMRFKAAYNLGNTGFEAGDFRAAADYYKEAIRLNPQSKEARHNLELALHKLDEAKKQQEQNKEQGKDQQQNQGQQCKNPQSKDAKKDQQQKDGQDKQDKQGDQQQQKQKGDKGDQQQGQDGQKSKDEPKDLSGKLSASTPGQLAKNQEGQKEGKQAKSVERNKAEALINNIQEDRSRYLRLQVPEDKQGGAKSGKYW